jgi:amidase
VSAPVTRVFRVADGMVEMNERVRFPARPMVGVVGVATGGATLTNGLAGEHGGNLDNHMHGPGSRIYFPVRQDGGLFAVGDMHASMGDGEICFTGVEIAGEVTVRFDTLKGKQARWPVTELAERWVTHATAEDFPDALERCSEEAAQLLVDEWGFTLEDAFIFLSVACDAGIAQACKPAPHFGSIARFSIPKIKATPSPFSPV